MGNLFAKALILLLGAWLITSGGLCAISAGFSPWALIGIGFAALGIWIIRVVFGPPTRNQADLKDKE